MLCTVQPSAKQSRGNSNSNSKIAVSGSVADPTGTFAADLLLDLSRDLTGFSIMFSTRSEIVQLV